MQAGQQPDDQIRGAQNLAALGLVAFAALLLALKIREARHVHLYGYDDSPLNVRFLWSWIIALIPLSGCILGLVGVYAALTSHFGSTPATAGNDLAWSAVITAVSGVVLLLCWRSGRKMRMRLAAARFAVGQGEYV